MSKVGSVSDGLDEYLHEQLTIVLSEQLEGRLRVALDELEVACHKLECHQAQLVELVLVCFDEPWDGVAHADVTPAMLDAVGVHACQLDLPRLAHDVDHVGVFELQLVRVDIVQDGAVCDRDKTSVVRERVRMGSGRSAV